MEASQNTLKKYIIDLLCSGELLFGVNYQVEINNLSNYCDLSFNDIRSIVAGIVTEASVTPINLSSMSTGIGVTVQQLIDNSASGSDISTLSTAIGGPLSLVTLNSLAALAGLSTLSTTIGTTSNLIGPGFSTLSTTIGLTSNLIAPGLSTVALFTSNTSNLVVTTSNTLYSVISSGLSTLSSTTGLTSNTIGPGFSTFSTLVSQNYSTLSSTTALASNTIGPGFSTLSTAIGIQANQFSSFSTYTLQTLSTLSTQIYDSFSTISALRSTTQAGLSSLSSQLGLALFAIPSTVSTAVVLTSTLAANTATISTLNVLSSLRVNGTLYVGTGTTTIDTNSISTGSIVLCNISVMQTAYFSSIFIAQLTSPDLSATASTLSTGIAQTYSTLSANIAALQPLSTFEVFTASNLSSLQFTAGAQPYWLVTGEGVTGAAYSSTLSRSYDGLNWQNIVNGNATRANGVSWNGAYWLLCGAGGPTGGSTIQKSYDGSVWIPSPYMGLSEVYSVSWNGTQWLAAGSGSLGQTMAKSLDGITWTTLQTPFWTQAYGAVWNGNTWVTYGSNNATPIGPVGSPSYYYTDSTIAVYNPANDVFTSVFISSLIFGGDSVKSITAMDWNTEDYFVAVGNLRYVYKSVNGLTWSNVTDTATIQVDSDYLKNLTAIKTNGPQWIILGSNKNANGYSNNSFYTLDSGANWNLATIPVSSFITGGLFYNSNNNYWLVTGSNARNSSVAYSVDGINWTVGGSNVGVGTGLFWNGSANCNVAQVWGTLGANSLVIASSITVPVLLAGSISSGTLTANFSTLSSYIRGTSNLIAPGFSSFSSVVWQNYSTLSSYIQSVSTGLSNLTVATTGASNFLYGIVSSGFSTLSTTIGFTSNLIAPGLSSVGLFTSNTSNYAVGSSNALYGVISTGFSTLSTTVGFTSNLIAPGLSSVGLFTSNTSNYAVGSSNTLYGVISTGFSTLSTTIGFTSNLIAPGLSSVGLFTSNTSNYAVGSSNTLYGVISTGFSTLSTTVGFTSNLIGPSASSFSSITWQNYSTLSSFIRQTSNLIGAPPVISTYSTLLVSSVFSSVIINTSTLFTRGLAAMSNISSVQGTFSTIGIGYQAVGGNVRAGGINYPTILNINGTGRVSTLIVDSICYASTFVGSFVFSIQTI